MVKSACPPDAIVGDTSEASGFLEVSAASAASSSPSEL